jgi:hypothetical protein
MKVRSDLYDAIQAPPGSSSLLAIGSCSPSVLVAKTIWSLKQLRFLIERITAEKRSRLHLKFASGVHQLKRN